MSGFLHPGRRGLTMIELMFVITILGVLLVVALPKMRGTGERAALETTGRDIARLSEYARQIAINQQKRTTLTFDKEERQWKLDLSVEEEDDESWRRASRELSSEEEEARTFHPRVSIRQFLVDGEELREDQLVITYYPSGSCSGGAILLQNQRERLMTVEIERATGRASAYLGEPMTFAEKLEAEGIDASRFAGAEEGATEGSSVPKGERFYRSAGSEEERVGYYEDAAARILGQVRNQYERQHAQDNSRSNGSGRGRSGDDNAPYGGSEGGPTVPVVQP